MGGSGSGKSTIQHSLPIKFLTNCTTRPLREGEINGYHINEVTEEEFLKLKDEGYFFETTYYAGNHYGTPNPMIERMKSGEPFHCTKDRHGVEQLKSKLKNRLVSIYIKPPSVDVIIERMRLRGDSSDEILQRIKHLEKTNELENERFADYIIVNDDLNKAIIDAHQIVIKELVKRD